MGAIGPFGIPVGLNRIPEGAHGTLSFKLKQCFHLSIEERISCSKRVSTQPAANLLLYCVLTSLELVSWLRKEVFLLLASLEHAK